MSYTIKGTIKSVGETQQITDSFSKREFSIETPGEYPQVRKLEFQKDNTTKLNGFNIGDSVEVSFFLNGREWTNPEGIVKVFNTDVAWKIDKIIKDERPPEQQITGGNNEDDLPF